MPLLSTPGAVLSARLDSQTPCSLFCSLFVWRVPPCTHARLCAQGGVAVGGIELLQLLWGREGCVWLPAQQKHAALQCVSRAVRRQCGFPCRPFDGCQPRQRHGLGFSGVASMQVPCVRVCIRTLQALAHPSAVLAHWLSWQLRDCSHKDCPAWCRNAARSTYILQQCRG